jgi:hypothetical protein
MKTIDYGIPKRSEADRGKAFYCKVSAADCERERLIHEIAAGSPFLVPVHYAFQSSSTLYLLLGEYIKNCS